MVCSLGTRNLLSTDRCNSVDELLAMPEISFMVLPYATSLHTMLRCKALYYNFTDMCCIVTLQYYMSSTTVGFLFAVLHFIMLVVCLIFGHIDMVLQCGKKIGYHSTT